MQSAPEVSAWAEEVATRLKMLQTSFADDPAEARQAYLVEEIARSLRDIGESRRPEYLAGLRERFPTAERVEVTKPAPSLAPSETAERSPQELAEELVERAPELTNEMKAMLGEKLCAVGLSVERAKGVELPLELLGKLGLAPDQPLDEQRLGKLLAALLDLVATQDSLVWNLWKNIAPKSIVRRETAENLRRTVGRYLAGDREVATLQITQMLDKTRQLTIGLLSALGPAGETYARHHLETFAPEKIRATVEAGASGFLTNVEQKCWRKYVELAGQLSGLAVENQIVNAIVAYTEEIIARPDGRGR
jgi:hypothetical protein